MTDVAECAYVVARANAGKRNQWCRLLGNEASRQRFFMGGDRLVIVGPSLMGSGGGWGACSDGTGLKQAALPFMNKCKHDTM